MQEHRMTQTQIRNDLFCILLLLKTSKQLPSFQIRGMGAPGPSSGTQGPKTKQIKEYNETQISHAKHLHDRLQKTHTHLYQLYPHGCLWLNFVVKVVLSSASKSLQFALSLAMNSEDYVNAAGHFLSQLHQAMIFSFAVAGTVFLRRSAV
jgi:hypothetical protein